MLKSIGMLCVIFTLLISMGCSGESEETDAVEPASNPVVAAEEVAADEYLKYEALFEKAKPHGEKYLALKDADPQAALAELKKGSRILYEDHLKSDVYAQMIFELDTAGEATQPQILALSELILEIFIDNGYPEELIENQRKSISEVQAEIEALKAAGEDPDAVSVGFQFDPTQ